MTKKEKAIARKNFFLEIWIERRDADGNHYSEVSGKMLPKKFSTTYFDHLIERSKREDLEFEKGNIALVTSDEHFAKTNGFPLPKHKELINKAIEKYGR